MERLWQRYFPRLAGLARGKLEGLRSRSAGPDDVALSAFATFCRRAEQGQFPHLHDRDDLRRLLFAITIHKAQKLKAREQRAKRGGGKVLGESAFPSADAAFGLEQVIAEEPTPEFAAQTAELWQRLLGRLQPEDLKIVELRLLDEHLSWDEIAVKLNCSARTIRRKLHKIEAIWKEECER